MKLYEIMDTDWDRYDSEPEDDFLNSFRVSDKLGRLSAGSGESSTPKNSPKEKKPKSKMTFDELRQHNKEMMHMPERIEDLRKFSTIVNQLKPIEIEHSTIRDISVILWHVTRLYFPSRTSPLFKYVTPIKTAGDKVYTAIHQWDLPALLSWTNKLKLLLQEAYDLLLQPTIHNMIIQNAEPKNRAWKEKCYQLDMNKISTALQALK